MILKDHAERLRQHTAARLDPRRQGKKHTLHKYPVKEVTFPEHEEMWTRDLADDFELDVFDEPQSKTHGVSGIVQVVGGAASESG